MSIPDDSTIQYSLLHLLSEQPKGMLPSYEVYRMLADQFPQLTYADLHDPYPNSVSHWANRVQWAVQHLRESGLLQQHGVSGKGLWTISSAGRAWLASLPNADDLLNELMAPRGA
jgi:restriction endonuclease Mrr